MTARRKDQAPGGLLRLSHWLIMGFLVLPVVAGLAGMITPALSDGGKGFAALLAWPGLGCAITLSLRTGLASTGLALGLTVLLLAAFNGQPGFERLRRALSPLLAVPHAAAALGIAFLIAPSGWIARLLSPWATGWTQPPDLLILNDPQGIALTLGLVAKELPFLLLMALAALPQCDAPRRQRLAASLGYGRVWGFLLAVLPDLYRQMRLPVFAVLAYAMTSVEMAVILGPNLPPPLAVQITHWMTDASLAHLGTAAAGALVQLALVGLGLALWQGVTFGLGCALPRLAGAGLRLRGLDPVAAPLAKVAGYGLTGGLVLALVGLALWSVAGLWSFPDALPARISLAVWQSTGPALRDTTALTLLIALVATLPAVALVLAAQEAEARGAPPPRLAGPLLYLPLLVPQIAFLPGLQMLALRLHVEGHWLAVATVHGVFVLPYVALSLAPAFRAWDSRHARIGASLGAGPNRIFWRLRLPMLLAPLLTATALGLAVSVGQYLPTLLIGGGRVPTLTTEAIALASGGNRRLIGAFGLLQMALPALGFALALTLPRLIYRHRRGLLTGVKA